MGLCKCPKRQVTNQFCFEHRVNVCEHCMITSHPKCVVQSYLQWLKDSDYDASCGLCSVALEQGDCVRLICYHVFHWDCLNARAAALPANTAPSGHLCPVCSEYVFPSPNLISPVADVLRTRLGQVNWGRSELGLPLLDGEKPPTISAHQQEHLQLHLQRQQQQAQQKQQRSQSTSIQPQDHSSGGINVASDTNGTPNMGDGASSSGHSVLNIEYDGPASSRRPLIARVPPVGANDSDDNKYKKRSPGEIFRRWSRRFYAPSSRPPWRRTWCAALIGAVIFVFILYTIALLGRRNGERIDDTDNDVQSHM